MVPEIFLTRFKLTLQKSYKFQQKSTNHHCASPKCNIPMTTPGLAKPCHRWNTDGAAAAVWVLVWEMKIFGNVGPKGTGSKLGHGTWCILVRAI